MRAAASGHSTLGIPASVARDFVKATHGMKVSRLPKRKVTKRQPFGSLAPDVDEQ